MPYCARMPLPLLRLLKGPLFGGQALNATDASLAPKLYHVVVALKHYKVLRDDGGGGACVGQKGRRGGHGAQALQGSEREGGGAFLEGSFLILYGTGGCEHAQEVEPMGGWCPPTPIPCTIRCTMYPPTTLPPSLHGLCPPSNPTYNTSPFCPPAVPRPPLPPPSPCPSSPPPPPPPPPSSELGAARQPAGVEAVHGHLGGAARVGAHTLQPRAHHQRLGQPSLGSSSKAGPAILQAAGC